MLDMRQLRRNPQEAGRRLARRGGDCADFEKLLPELLKLWRHPTAEIEGLDAVKNKISKQIGLWKREPPTPENRVEAAHQAWELLAEAVEATRVALCYYTSIVALGRKGFRLEHLARVTVAPRPVPEGRRGRHLQPVWSLLPRELRMGYLRRETELLRGMAPPGYRFSRRAAEIFFEPPRRPPRLIGADPVPMSVSEPDWGSIVSEMSSGEGDGFWDALFSDTMKWGAGLCQSARGAAEKAYELSQTGSVSEGVPMSMALLPNFPSDKTPDGAGEADNIVLHTYDADGEEAAEDFASTAAGAAPHHVDVGEALGGFHAERGVAMSGSRFVVLSGQLARLHRALGAWMLDLHLAEHGYTEWTVPHLLTWEAAEGSGQLPKFAEDIFQVRGTGKGADGEERPMVLISTSEMALLNVWRDQILDEGQLPQRLTALTPCYRREAGAAGRDTRGLIRLHQFEKVEMVQFCHPEQSGAALREMLGHAERVLQLLRLPYRVLDLCAGDLGFAANRTFDLEVWLPGAAKDGGAWREISSCSNCGDFQARRAAIRFRPEGGGKPQYLHTLNGSGVAVGRCLAAVLENYHREGQGVEVPEVLRPYMGGQELLPFAEAAGGAKGG